VNLQRPLLQLRPSDHYVQLSSGYCREITTA